MHNKKHRNPVFVVQEHSSKNHHYDFRLENSGALISWSVPKGLSKTPNEKHLAIRTQNHPLNYADFEGIIPEGEYGAGRVTTLDKGTYESLLEYKTIKQGLEDGALKFKLHGKKFKGNYAMARMREVDGQEQWIIFKVRDLDAGIN